MTKPDRRELRTIDDLVRAGLVAEADAAQLTPVAQRYAVAITPSVATLIDPADPADPIARQFVPAPAELIQHPAEHEDPIGDAEKSPVAGIVHRYPDRVLLKLVGVCPVYCRFCFRREMVGPGAGTSLSEAEVTAALAYIAARPSIWEVIVTGGDPLILSPRRIAAITQRLAAVAHVKTVRWHTRVPVVAPDLVTDDMTAALTSGRTATWLAVHANHPREFTPSARAAIARLSGAGIGLVSQSVLLAGVNDDADTLEALMRVFLEARIKPYYLHHPDLAPGTTHFRVPIARGQALMAELQRRVSGLAMPAYVLDIPGAHGKVPLTGPHIDAIAHDGSYTIRDRHGGLHRYFDAC
ncbi:MAG: lysine-2,3-aminomutase-like protein [Hyphomicrobiaceae bacterium]|nr:lysine-2,3-aminomutase-like protein [Hyphomicrobiaceae bacterium]